MPATGNCQAYSVQDLGALVNLSGRSDSGTYGINEAGAVCGVNVTNGSYHAMVYNGSWTDLGTLGGAESLAAAINASGQVAGYSQAADGSTNAFLWTPGGKDGVASNPQMKNLGNLGSPACEGFSINSSGQITGYSDLSSSPTGLQHAFLYSGGKMSDLGVRLTVLVNSYGYGINALGHVVGLAYDATFTAPHAFFFDGSHAMDLGLFGGQGSSALAINDQDNIVGYYTDTNSLDRGFSYLRGTMTDLGTLGGGFSYPLALNNSNAIVGGSYVDANNTIYHAFIWTNGLMADLNGLLDQSGAGWTLIEARGINDAGQITGVGSIAGVNHAFLLTPASTVVPAPNITSIQASGSSVVLQFTSVAAKHYSVQTNATLSSGAWGNLRTNILGTGATLSITNAQTGSANFFRVKLSLP
jgi:probable HAF family extracellular repeat protein